MEMKDKIKQRREELGLTLEEVANIVALSSKTEKHLHYVVYGKQ